MSNIPADLQYTREHEYVARTKQDGVVQVGITDYAQGELGDVVYVALPKVGTVCKKMDAFGTIEAVKAVSDLYCPIAGEIVEANAVLDADPAAVNREPYGAGWMIRLRVKDPAELKGLLSADDYRKHIGE